MGLVWELEKSRMIVLIFGIFRRSKFSYVTFFLWGTPFTLLFGHWIYTLEVNLLYLKVGMSLYVPGRWHGNIRELR
jgi:hypothetical protein